MNERLPRRKRRGAKPIVIPMIRQQYDDIWQDAEGAMRAFVDEWAQLAPELFPEDFDQGYCLHGFGHESRKTSRPETAEDRVGRRHTVLASAQLRHQLHDRNRR